MPLQEKGSAGLSCAESMTCTSCFTGYADLERILSLTVYKSRKVEHLFLCPRRVRNVDYLLMARPVAISTLGNPP
jgi:hypothetical protein